MKKLYLFGLMGLGIAVNAQTQKFPATKADKVSPAVNVNKTDYSAPSPVRVKSNTSSTPQSGFGKSASWTKVGSTNFDRQTNCSVYRRILAYPDGKVSVNWTTSTDGPENNFLGRGSGYNHFNGTTWGPVTPLRIEGLFRAGYPSFDYNGTTEIIMSHRVDTSGKSGGLLYNTNGAIGGTTWTAANVLQPVLNQPSVLWPRTVIAGNYMHVIANYTTPSAGQPGDTAKANGVKSPTVYSRYNFTNSTWEVENIALPDYDSTRWLEGSADNYAIDASGENVAIFMSGITNDKTLWKSGDHGQTWTTTIIDSFPFPAFNDTPFSDTLPVIDGSVAVKLDATGKAHCFWGGLRIVWNSSTNALGLFLGTNSIQYWYEGRPDSAITSVAGAPDVNDNGTLDIGDIDNRNRYGNAAVSSMPYAVTAPNGDIYLVYSALTEEDADPQGANFRDVYVVFSKDNGVTWSEIQNLTATMGLNKEQMFGSAAIANNTLHLTFMESEAVGFFSSTDNPTKTGPFDIDYYSIPLADIDNMKVGLQDLSNNLFTIEQNYPNPFSSSTIIPVKLNSKSDVTVSVMNMLGQVVYSNTFRNTTSGMNELEVASPALKSGIYFYNVEAGGYKATGKMIAE
jgi:hypothetical protein